MVRIDGYRPPATTTADVPAESRLPAPVEQEPKADGDRLVRGGSPRAGTAAGLSLTDPRNLAPGGGSPVTVDYQVSAPSDGGDAAASEATTDAPPAAVQRAVAAAETDEARAAVEQLAANSWFMYFVPEAVREDLLGRAARGELTHEQLDGVDNLLLGIGELSELPDKAVVGALVSGIVAAKPWNTNGVANDAVEVLTSPAFAALAAATQLAVAESVGPGRGYDDNAVCELLAAPWFAGLSPGVQADTVRAAARDKSFLALVTDLGFARLDPATQAAVLDAWAAHPGDELENALRQVLGSPAFADAPEARAAFLAFAARPGTTPADLEAVGELFVFGNDPPTAAAQGLLRDALVRDGFALTPRVQYVSNLVGSPALATLPAGEQSAIVGTLLARADARRFWNDPAGLTDAARTMAARDPRAAAALATLTRSPAFKALPPQAQVALLSQVVNYPNELAIQYLGKLAGNHWFAEPFCDTRTEDPARERPNDRYRLAKTVAYAATVASQGSPQQRAAIVTSLDYCTSNRCSLSYLPLDSNGSTTGRTTFINELAVPAGPRPVDDLGEAAQHATLHTFVHEVSHQMNWPEGAYGEFMGEYRSFYVGFIAELGRPPTRAECLARCQTVLRIYERVAAAFAQKDPANPGQPGPDAMAMIAFMEQLTDHRYDPANPRSLDGFVTCAASAGPPVLPEPPGDGFPR